MNIKTTNKNYDIHGMEMLRMIRMVIIWKLLRIDDVVGKPKLSDLLQLAIHHYAGHLTAVITVKHEKRWLRSLVLIREYRARTYRLAGKMKQRITKLIHRK